MNFKRIHKTVRIVWISAGLIFTTWLFLSFQAAGFNTDDILASDVVVAVTNTDKYISFTPSSLQSDIALIFYPGAMVEPTAYAPLARRIAESGYSVFIVNLPWRLAPFESHVISLFDSTKTLMQSENYERYVMVGHSKGAALAGQFTKTNPKMVDALVLIATSHPKEDAFTLSDTDIPVLKITASLDGLASPEEVEENKKFLPDHTKYYDIEGGNHSQFGYYGFQLGDRRATISRDQQQDETFGVLREFLIEMEN